MPESPSRRRDADRDANVQSTPAAPELEAQLVPTTASQQARATDALRLLAVWAVRAARAHTSAPSSP